ncbi:hypothetical protein RSP03_19260 [Cereibacter sphaeroides]|nr:hypothetical protein RSP03_19260 [Cereibacter sphaeroides]
MSVMRIPRRVADPSVALWREDAEKAAGTPASGPDRAACAAGLPERDSRRSPGAMAVFPVA